MFECRWGVVCWGSAAEDLARGTVYSSPAREYSRAFTTRNLHAIMLLIFSSSLKSPESISGVRSCTLLRSSSVLLEASIF